MKKKVILLPILLLFAIFLFNLVLAASQTVTISPSTGEVNQPKIYNISIQNTNATGDINEVRINLYGLTVDSATSGTSTGIANSGSGNLFIFAGVPVIAASATQYFWFNISTTGLGVFSINITSIDNQSSPASVSENKTITISDTVAPVIAFVSPTPSNNDILEVDSIITNFSVDETGSGVNNVTIYLYNSTALISTQTDTSAPYTYTFASLEDGTYYLNATVWDNANNSDSTSTRTIGIVTGSSCLPSWSCSWTECTNGTQTQTNCVDANNCGFIAPAATQACESCISNWDCGDWSPATCSGDSNQTRLCTDLNSCEAPDSQTRSCVVGGTSAANASGLSIFSSSTLFFVVLGIIIASVVGVFIVLMRLKKKSSSMNSGNSDSGYPVYSPPRGPPPSPPAMPPQGYSNPPRTYNRPPAYQNQPQNY